MMYLLGGLGLAVIAGAYIVHLIRVDQKKADEIAGQKNVLIEIGRERKVDAAGDLRVVRDRNKLKRWLRAVR